MRDEEQRQLFQSVVEQFTDSTYRVAYRLTSHHELAKELLQETFLAAWQNINQLQKPEAIAGWLFAILRNQCSKQRMRERRNQHQGLESEPLARNQEPGDFDSVQQAINQLDDDHRLPIILVSMEGWSVDEASKSLGVPRGTILSRLHRARLRLKQLLALDWKSTEK